MTGRRCSTRDDLLKLRFPRRFRWRAAAAWLGAVAFVAFLVSGYVRVVPEFSITDEFVHFDYVAKVSEGGVVNYNERVGQIAMHAEACRGIQGGFAPPPCRERAAGYDPDDFQYRGVNTAGSHTPAYYVITLAGARILQLTPTRDWDLLTASRLFGAAWLLAGLGMFSIACSAAGIGLWSSLTIGLAMSTTQLVLQSSARVNNDAAALLVGSFMLWTGLRIVQGGSLRTWGTLAVIGALAASALKITHVVAVVAFFALLVVAGGRTRSRRHLVSRLTPLGVASLVVAGLTYVAWDLLQTRDALTPLDFAVVQNPAFHVEEIRFQEAVRQTWVYLRLLEEAWLPGQFSLNVAVFLEGLSMFGLLLLGAAEVGAEPRSIVTRVAVATMAAAVVTPVSLMLLTWYTNHVYIPIPGRYGLALLPWFAFIAAAACHRWRGARLGAAVAVVIMFLAWAAQFHVLL